MAVTSGSFGGNAVAPGGYGGNYVYFYWSLASQNIANNTSTISWRMGWHFNQADHQLDNGACYVNGAQVYANGGRIYNYAGNFATRDMDIASGSATITHNADGTKTFSASAGMTAYSGFRSEGSNNWELPTIPRASTPTVSPASVTAGSAVTITTNRASTAFTHDLTWSFGSSSGSIATGVGASYAWTVPTSIANLMTSSESGKVTITCVTQNGGTAIGTKTVTLTVNVPTTAAYQPTISSTSIAEATAGLAAKFAAYVQKKSTLNISMVAAGANGSTISSYSISVDGKSFAAASATTTAIEGSGTLPVVFTATDSRNRTVTKTVNITVLAYNAPTLTAVDVQRATSAGVLDNQGTYAKVMFSASITTLNNKNNKTYTVRYKLKTASAWTSVTVPSPQYTMTNASILVENMNADSAYDYEVIATDFFSSNTVADTLPAAFTILDVRRTGKGIAVGTVSSDDTFNVAMPLKVTKTDASDFFSVPVPAGAAGRTLWDIIGCYGVLRKTLTWRGADGETTAKDKPVCFFGASGGAQNGGTFNVTIRASGSSRVMGCSFDVTIGYQPIANDMTAITALSHQVEVSNLRSPYRTGTPADGSGQPVPKIGWVTTKGFCLVVSGFAHADTKDTTMEVIVRRLDYLENSIISPMTDADLSAAMALTTAESLPARQHFLWAHPVGSVCLTTNTDETTAAQMATKYGGTWQALGYDIADRGMSGAYVDAVTRTGGGQEAYTASIDGWLVIWHYTANGAACQIGIGVNGNGYLNNTIPGGTPGWVMATYVMEVKQGTTYVINHNNQAANQTTKFLYKYKDSARIYRFQRTA